MNRQAEILELIGELRGSHTEMEHIFLNGRCFNLYLLLRRIYPQSIPWYNSDHIITEIDGKYYDITGQVSNKNYQKLTDVHKGKSLSRVVKQLKKHQ